MHLFELAEEFKISVAVAEKFLCKAGYIVKGQMSVVSPDAEKLARKELPAIIAEKEKEKEKKKAVSAKKRVEKKKKEAEKKKKEDAKKKKEDEKKKKEDEIKKKKEDEIKKKEDEKKKKEDEKKKKEDEIKKKKEDEIKKKKETEKKEEEKKKAEKKKAEKKKAEKKKVEKKKAEKKKAEKKKEKAEEKETKEVEPKRTFEMVPLERIHKTLAEKEVELSARKAKKNKKIEMVPLDRVQKNSPKANDVISSIQSAQSHTISKRPRKGSAKKNKKSKTTFTGIENREDLINRPRLSSSAVLRQKITDQGVGFKPGFKHSRPFRKRKNSSQSQTPLQQLHGEIIVEFPIGIRDFSQLVGIKVGTIIGRLMKLGFMLTINDYLDNDTIELLAADLDLQIITKPKEENLEETVFTSEEKLDEEGGETAPRPPIVTFMGHVDHGKTSLLDAIRETNIASGESGGITQHIGASEVEGKFGKITFIDTPGHEAFTTMRARGAQATDIAVLVVAADDGLMPQSLEAIDHSRAAGVPILVAINKCDLVGANPDNVLRQLAERNLNPEDWGGETICCKVSAITKDGINHLLEMIVLQAEILELKARPAGPASGVVLESEVDPGKGSTVSLLVQNGLLKKGDPIVCQTCFGRARALINYKGERVNEAGPSQSVQVLGFSEIPAPGSIFKVASSEKHARELVGNRQTEEQLRKHAETQKLSLENFYKRMENAEVKELPIILKGDAQGTTDVIKVALEQISTETAKVIILHSGVGDVSENDIILASASNAVVVAFKVGVPENVRQLSRNEGIEVKKYDVIYHATEEIEKALVGLLDPVYEEIVTATIEVRQVFKLSSGTIAGCYVTNGTVERNNKARVIRSGKEVFNGDIQSLKRVKDEAKEVRSGFECGILLRNFKNIQEGDIIESYKLEKQEAKL